MGEVITCDGDNHYRMPHLRKSRVIKVFGIVPHYVRLKPQALEKLQTIREKQRAVWLELFGEDEEEEPDWLFEPVFRLVRKIYQL